MPQAGRKRIRLGDLLVQQGKITEDMLMKALKEQRVRHTKLGETLISMGYVKESDIVDILTEQLNISYVELRDTRPDENAVYTISEAIAKKYNVIPISFDENNPSILNVAMSDPLDFTALDDLEIVTSRRIRPVLSTTTQIAATIDKYFGRATVMKVADQYKDELAREGVNANPEADVVRQSAVDNDNSPIVVMVRSIIEQAIRQRASDIHYEPTHDGIRIRFRIDGNLVEAMSYDNSINAGIIARLKIISGMDIAEKRKPQDGRASVVVDLVVYDIRVSSIPTVYGEKIVMRLANKMGLTRDERQLGLHDDDLVRFHDMLSHKHGIILVTGPTGSGKSTTLYTALNKLNREEVNIVTVEDPVEANIDGINQIQTNDRAGLTFATALRSILRQDADIIMIGEIRDAETAEIDIQASITGHLVVSTLHTNSTSSSVARLLNMGLESYLISDALVGVIAQRLVRTLCERCKRPREATIDEKNELGVPAEKPLTLYEPTGCQVCSHLGYYGRTAVYEMMPITPNLRTAIARMEPTSRIKDIALQEGMKTLYASAKQLVLDGKTSIDEMRSIAYEDDDALRVSRLARQSAESNATPNA